MATPTHFLEANALLAIQEGNYGLAVESLQQMSDAELGILATAARQLADACRDVASSRRRSS